MWCKLGNTDTITNQSWVIFNESYLTEADFTYPVSFNGKMRFKITLPISLSKEEIEKEILSEPKTHHYLGGEKPKKIIIVPNRIINIVV